MRLLLAEDEKLLSDALVVILSHSGYSVDPVYDGAEALSYLENGDYDVRIDYYFGPTLATDEYVLKQFFVILPEDDSHEEWINTMKPVWERKLFESGEYYYMSPVMLSDLLSEDQQRTLADRAVAMGQVTEEEFTLANWPLVTYFYSDGVFQFNGTGAALYVTAPKP